MSLQRFAWMKGETFTPTQTEVLVNANKFIHAYRAPCSTRTDERRAESGNILLWASDLVCSLRGAPHGQFC